MKPNFALNLSHEGISLLHRAKTGWLRVGDVALDAPDLNAQLQLLRQTAADLEKDRAALIAKGPLTPPANRVTNASKLQDAAGEAAAKDETDYAAGGQDYFYDPRNKRDPFRSYRFVGESAPEKTFGPLGDFELGQLELSAVIWDATNPRALILDPGGRSYIVREGSQIGKNSGQVIHIGDNLVLVKETYENFAGEKTTKDVELRIRLSQGG